MINESCRKRLENDVENVEITISNENIEHGKLLLGEREQLMVILPQAKPAENIEHGKLFFTCATEGLGYYSQAPHL